VLIAGGLGFIGSNLARRLVQEGALVSLIDCMQPEYGGNHFNVADIRDNVNVQVTDLRESAIVRKLIRQQDLLFNLAGQTSHLDSMRDPQTDLEMNCRAQLSLLEASSRPKIITSSMTAPTTCM
jgi:UDP-glucose 4-epimerase